MEIKAAVTPEQSAEFQIMPLQLSDPNDDEILVRITAVGICHTDLAAREQHIPFPLPAVLGHEGAGIVEKVGARVKKVKPGDHVALSWMCCGACPSCKAGRDPYCENFSGPQFRRGQAGRDHHPAQWRSGRPWLVFRSVFLCELRPGRRAQCRQGPR